MGKFLELMMATEADWDAETGSAELPVGSYIFQLKSWKADETKDLCFLYFAVIKAASGSNTPEGFRADKYRPVGVMFGERNIWIFKNFLKASGIALDKVQTQMPKLLGKYYTADVAHNEGKEPNPDGTKKIFVNLNNIVPYNPNAASAAMAAVSTDDEDDDEGGNLG